MYKNKSGVIIMGITILCYIIISSVCLTESSAQDKIKLTYASYISQTATQSKSDLWFMSEVTRRTNGRVIFETYFSEALFKSKDIFPAIGRGAVDIGQCVPGTYNPELLPLTGVVLPYQTDKLDVVSFAFADLVNEHPAVSAQYSKNNTKVLYSVAPPENSTAFKNPVTKLEDIKGKKIRAVGGIADAMMALGATAVALSSADAFDSLQKGLIDGYSSLPISSYFTQKIYEIAPFSLASGEGVYAVFQTVCNLNKYNSFPEDIKKVIESVASEAAKNYVNICNEANEKGISDLKAGRGQIYALAPQELSRWKKIAAPVVWGKWISWVNKQGLPGQAVLDKYLDLIEKYRTKSQYIPGAELWQNKYGK